MVGEQNYYFREYLQGINALPHGQMSILSERSHLYPLYTSIITITFLTPAPYYPLFFSVPQFSSAVIMFQSCLKRGLVPAE